MEFDTFFGEIFQFQSTPSVWRETGYSVSSMQCFEISIHSLRVEGDILQIYLRAHFFHFNPLPPCGGRLLRLSLLSLRHTISIHSLRVEGDDFDPNIKYKLLQFQSTPSVWRETAPTLASASAQRHFNPLPPCGGRPYYTTGVNKSQAFQSTPSVWRETRAALRRKTPDRNFNPLPPCGGRPGIVSRHKTRASISIHSLRVEGDYFVRIVQKQGAISIHSLRVEGDVFDTFSESHR